MHVADSNSQAVHYVFIYKDNAFAQGTHGVLKDNVIKYTDEGQ